MLQCNESSKDKMLSQIFGGSDVLMNMIKFKHSLNAKKGNEKKRDEKLENKIIDKQKKINSSGKPQIKKSAAQGDAKTKLEKLTETSDKSKIFKNCSKKFDRNNQEDCFTGDTGNHEYKSALLSLKVDTSAYREWDEVMWVKYLLKIKRALPVLIEYHSNNVTTLAINSADPTNYYRFGSAENMFESIIDQMEIKSTYLNMYVLITKAIGRLSELERIVVAYFVDKKDCINKALKYVSKRSVYRMGEQIIENLADILRVNGYSAAWMKKAFGLVVDR